MSEKSQHQIRFENLFFQSLSGWWTSYPVGSCGNVIHWVYVFSERLDVAEQCQVGNNEVTYGGVVIAKIETDEALQMTYFTDCEEFQSGHFADNQRIFHEGLRKYKPFVREWTKRYREIRPLPNFYNKRYSLKEKFYIAKPEQNG
jgi:hypothetical protein